MNKILFLLFILMTPGVNSQIIRTAVVFDDESNHSKFQLKKNNKFTNGFKNNISTGIWRKFNSDFAAPADVHWYVDEREITAYFIWDSENVMIKYKRSGALIWIRKVYEGSRLDSIVTSFISNEVEKGFVISLVTEIIIDGQTVYEISLHLDKESYFLRVLRSDERSELKLIDKTIFKKES